MAESRRTPDAGAGSREARIARQLLPWALFIGVLARAIPYLSNRSLWLDEAMLALNIERRSFGELVGQLDFNQAAPLGFLWLEKTAEVVLGPGGLALRLWPYLAALAALFAFAAVAKRVLRPGAAILVVAGFALSGSLVYYAAEVKQYAFDVLCATALLWLALRAPDRGEWLPVLAFGALGVWFSYPLVFLLPGALAFAWLHRGDRAPERRRLGLAAALWAASFLAAFWLTARSASQNPLMARFWTEGFMPLPPTSASELAWFGEAVAGWIRNTFDFTETVDPVRTVAIVAGGALAALGCVSGWREDRRTLALVGLPILLALLAAALRLYPFQGRLILFLVPSTLLLIGWGLEAGFAAGRVGSTGVLVAGAVWLAGCVVSLADWVGAPYREELRPLLQGVAARIEPGDRVYVHSGAQHAQLFYERTCASCRLEPATVIRGRFLAGDPEAVEAEVAGLVDGGRVWALFAHEWWGYGDAERDEIVARLRERATRVEVLEAPGAEAYLFDLATREP